MCPLPPSRVYAFSFAVLCRVSLVYSFFRFLSSIPPVSYPFFAAPDGLVAVVRCRSACRDCRLALSLSLFLVVCKG